MIVNFSTPDHLSKYYFAVSQYGFPVFGLPNILPEIFEKISENSYTPPTPPYPHPITQTVNPLRTLNSLLSKTHFDCISTFISHTLQNIIEVADLSSVIDYFTNENSFTDDKLS